MKRSKLIIEMPQMTEEDSRSMERWNRLVNELLSADKVNAADTKRTKTTGVSKKNKTTVTSRLRGGK